MKKIMGIERDGFAGNGQTTGDWIGDTETSGGITAGEVIDGLVSNGFGCGTAVGEG